jgi:hypothetical protein
MAVTMKNDDDDDLMWWVDVSIWNKQLLIATLMIF